MPVEPRAEVITDPRLARQAADAHRALRRSMVVSIVLDVLIAIFLVAIGLPVALVAPAAVLIIAISTFALQRVIRSEEARLAHFRDPTTGELHIPDA